VIIQNWVDFEHREEDGLGKGNFGRGDGGGVSVFAGLGGVVVLEPSPLQRVRRETRPRANHLQRRICLLLQSSSARHLRNHSRSFQRVTNLTLALSSIVLRSIQFQSHRFRISVQGKSGELED